MSRAASEPSLEPTVRPLEYPAGGRIRTATLYTTPSARPRAAVIVQHGLFGDRRMREIDRACRALAISFDVVAPDLRGHGEGAGWFTWGRAERGDLLDLVAFLSELHPAVGMVGFSIGGFISILAAAPAPATEDHAGMAHGEMESAEATDAMMPLDVRFSTAEMSVIGVLVLAGLASGLVLLRRPRGA